MINKLSRPVRSVLETLLAIVIVWIVCFVVVQVWKATNQDHVDRTVIVVTETATSDQWPRDVQRYYCPSEPDNPACASWDGK